MDSKQVILITGASTGFGRLFAETLARHGHTVFATMRDPRARNAKNFEAIRELAKQESLSLHVLELDVKNSYVRLPDNIFHEFTEGTVEAWVNWDEPNVERLARTLRTFLDAPGVS